MILVRYEDKNTGIKGKPFWVKEKNKYFKWYKDNFKILKEIEVVEK